MKNFLLSLILLPLSALAGTIDLAPTGCGLTRSCTPDTGTGDVVTISAPYGNYANVYVNGVLYRSAAMGQWVDFDSFPLYTSDGASILFTAHFTTTRVCTRSGRGQTCHTNWYLTDGSVSQ